MTLSYRSALALAALAALGLAAARPAAAQNLNGQPVNVTELFPDKSTIAYNEGTKTITPGGAVFTTPFESITVTPAQVTFTFTNFGVGFTPAAFSGFQIAETGASPVGITGVTLDPSSNLTGFDASRISFDATDVFANFQGLNFTSSNKVTLNLTFAPAAVPEPSQTLAFACGALGLAGAGRRPAQEGGPARRVGASRVQAPSRTPGLSNVGPGVLPSAAGSEGRGTASGGAGILCGCIRRPVLT